MEGAIPNFSAHQLDHDLKLSQRGGAEGTKNLPSPEERKLSNTEQLVVSRVDGALKQSSNELLGLGTGQDFTTLPQDLESLAGEPQTILTQFRARKARAQSAVGIELTNAHQDFARAYRDYRAFRIQHNLTETEPSYDNVFWRKVFWLALLFTIEVAANGWVIGQASPGGLVQGWTTALMISVLVVLTGSLIGAGPWRYLNYRGADGSGLRHRIWAIPALGIGISLLFFFAFYIAHYRYALSQTSLDAPVPNNILTAMAATPFQPFQQLESFALFIIALLIGVFAIARGAHWDEPYPGYGLRHRRMEEARERSKDLAVRLSDEVDAAKRAADEALNDIAEKSQNAVGALRQAIARTQDNAAQWDYSAQEILNEGREAIAIYRDANRATRNVREPSYFSVDPFANANPPSSGQILEKLSSAFQRATANITQCKSQLAGARAQLEAEYHSFYDDELSPFLKGIADNATVAARTEFLVPANEDDAPPRPAARPQQQRAEPPRQEFREGPREPQPQPVRQQPQGRFDMLKLKRKGAG
jgi:hypothetical protein